MSNKKDFPFIKNSSAEYTEVDKHGLYEYGVIKYKYRGETRYRACIVDCGFAFMQKSHEWFDNYEQAAELAKVYAQAHKDACARTAARNAAYSNK